MTEMRDGNAKRGRERELMIIVEDRSFQNFIMTEGKRDHVKNKI